MVKTETNHDKSQNGDMPKWRQSSVSELLNFGLVPQKRIRVEQIFTGLVLLLLPIRQYECTVSDLLFCVAAFCPFHIGNFAMAALQAQELVSELYLLCRVMLIKCRWCICAVNNF